MMGETMLRGGGIDAHAADGIGDGCRGGVVGLALLAAANALRRRGMMVAGVNSARAMGVIVNRLRHPNSPRHLKRIP
jgi:hypothetical protein